MKIEPMGEETIDASSSDIKDAAQHHTQSNSSQQGDLLQKHRKEAKTKTKVTPFRLSLYIHKGSYETSRDGEKEKEKGLETKVSSRRRVQGALMALQEADVRLIAGSVCLLALQNQLFVTANHFVHLRRIRELLC